MPLTVSFDLAGSDGKLIFDVTDAAAEVAVSDAATAATGVFDASASATLNWPDCT